MLTLTGENIYLRALEPEDLEFLHQIENDEHIWELSSTKTPYSKFVLKKYLDNSHLDIYEIKQLRLMICDKDHHNLGMIDLYDFDPANKRAGIGILIADAKDRSKGHGRKALQLLIDYGRKHLNLHQIHASIMEGNTASLHLFKSLGFKECGVREEWIYVNGVYKNEHLYQYIYVH